MGSDAPAATRGTFADFALVHKPGGSHEMMADLNRARGEAQKDRGV